MNVKASVLASAFLIVADMYDDPEILKVLHTIGVAPDGSEEPRYQAVWHDPEVGETTMFVTGDGAMSISTSRSIANRAIADRAVYATATYLDPELVEILAERAAAGRR